MAEELLRWITDGQQALETGRYADALDAFTRVRDQLPAEVPIALALANVHRLLGDLSASRSVLLQAHARGDWSVPFTAFALGDALLEAGAPREAAACFQRVVKTMPADVAAAGALAGARRALGEAAAAWPLIDKALRKAPANPALLLTAAQVRHDLSDFPAALRFLDRAEAARPGHRATRVQRAYSTLIQGASAEGWALFDERALPQPPTGARDWHGEPLDGGSVLVTAEQGVGDQFQFVRFVPLLGERGAGRVVVECHADAVSLLSANGFEAVARGTQTETDWHVPMLSLPHRLQLGANVGGERVPYLHAPTAGSFLTDSSDHSRKGQGARRRFGLRNWGQTPIPPAAGALQSNASHSHKGGTARRRFGLVWAGNPSFPGRVTRDFDEGLLPSILATPGIDWISLQFGENHPAGLERAELPGDWAGTAELLAELDGLVTTDTGVAHLAGAMGVPTFVMLQYVPDWRWGSPWRNDPVVPDGASGPTAEVERLAQRGHQIDRTPAPIGSAFFAAAGRVCRLRPVSSGLHVPLSRLLIMH